MMQSSNNLMKRFRRSGPGKAVVRLARRVIDGCVERYLNISTAGSCGGRGGGVYGDSHPYEPLDYPFLAKCLRAMDLRPDDVVFEIGCGMGRVVVLMARRPVARVVGVELDEILAARARENLAALRGRQAPVEIVAGDAALTDYAGGTMFYIFNAFGPITLQAVLDRIRMGGQAKQRLIRIIYVNPVHQEVFESNAWLRQDRRLRSRWFRMEATLWTGNPAALPAPELKPVPAFGMADRESSVAAGHTI